MIPILSSLSVSYRPEICLRFRCSSRYLRIPPLHLEFQSPLRYSSQTVFNAVPELSSGISRQTYPTTCGPFTPNKSEQRSPPTYYRGCWHVVSRGFLQRYRHVSSLLTAVYNPKTFIPHAALLGQTFVHCPKFSTAASRRPATHHRLGGPLPHQLANGTRTPLQAHCCFDHQIMRSDDVIRYYLPFPEAIPNSKAGCSRVPHPCATGALLLPFDLHA